MLCVAMPTRLFVSTPVSNTVKPVCISRVNYLDSTEIETEAVRTKNWQKLHKGRQKFILRHNDMITLVSGALTAAVNNQ